MKISNVILTLLGIALSILGVYYTLTSSVTYSLMIGMLIMGTGSALLPPHHDGARSVIFRTIFYLATVGITIFIYIHTGRWELEVLYKEIDVFEHMLALPPHSVNIGAVVLAFICVFIGDRIAIKRK